MTGFEIYQLCAEDNQMILGPLLPEDENWDHGNAESQDEDAYLEAVADEDLDAEDSDDLDTADQVIHYAESLWEAEPYYLPNRLVRRPKPE